MNVIWSDFDVNSENSQKMIKAKQINDDTYWPTMREVFKHDCATLPLNRFRLWASVWNVPLVTQYRTSRFQGEAFYAAARDEEIAHALEENWIGVTDEQVRQHLRPTNDFDTSTQRVQNMGHLLITDFAKKVKNLKSIVEIGAGYGDMCSLVHDLGFEGEYTIVDIPETRPIQEYYLGKQDIKPKWSFEDDNVSHADLVIATWSLSETPLEYRAKLMPKINKSKNWLIMAQSEVFGNKVNDAYFTEFFKGIPGKFEKIPLNSEQMKQWDGDNNYYVVHA